MTRASLDRTLRRAYLWLGLVLALSLAAKFAGRIPGLAGTPVERAAADLYDYLKDMALVFVTVVAAYLANVFQKRSKFVASLEEEWRGIVRTKSALFTYCEKPYVSTDDYLAALCRISETIDNMRIVYANAGETESLVGLYPYAPLHDMRRALQSLDPRKRAEIPAEDKTLARDAVLQSFSALRETMLEELDLDEPTHPLLIPAGRRLKQPGAARRARTRQDRQRARQEGRGAPRPDVDAFLNRLAEAEQAAQNGQNGPTPGGR
ncbi:hypothetical protein [Hyphomicrobium sp.]|uniref:hypothetical protein n=1 Tax=Hyphomicrobium sp. TaxID=82 RepID=UPI002FE15F6F